MTSTCEIERTAEREGAGERWRRRTLTIPLYLTAAWLCVRALPVLVAVALFADLLLRRRWLLTRCVLAFSLYLICEAGGILGSFLLWIANGACFGGMSPRYQRWNYALQSLWARTLLDGACRIFSLQVEVEGEDAVAPGPILLLVRHASTIDTLLASRFVSRRHRLRLRYVMKRELLWDPCLDIVGHRLPNVFVRRGSAQAEREIASVRNLARDLGPDDGVIIYPEGTRFTHAKRTAILEKLRVAGESHRLQRAESFRHVLPPRLGGTLAVLEARPDLDCVFLAHVGFEVVGSLNDLWNGRLIGRRIRLKFWRVPSADIPSGEGARGDWIHREWQEVDNWIDQQTDGLPENRHGEAA